MIAKPAGSTAMTIQLGMLQATVSPTPRSMRTTSRLPRQSDAVIAVATVSGNSSIDGRNRSGKNCGVLKASRELERAASPAPTSATHSVRCCTRTMEPGTPAPNSARPATSSSASSAIAAKTAVAIAFSNRWTSMFSARRPRPVSDRRLSAAAPRRRDPRGSTRRAAPGTRPRRSSATGRGWRHRPTATFSPLLSICFTASASIFRMSARSRSPALRAAASSGARDACGIRSQVRTLITVPPTSGAHLTSVMCGASL